MMYENCVSVRTFIGEETMVQSDGLHNTDEYRKAQNIASGSFCGASLHAGCDVCK